MKTLPTLACCLVIGLSVTIGCSNGTSVSSVTTSPAHPSPTPKISPTPTPTPPPPPPPAITEYALPANSNPLGITAGPDGAIWFTENGPTSNVGRITVSGTITEFPIPAGTPPHAEGITAGPDGNLWFVEYHRNAIARLSTSGVFTEFAIPTEDSGPMRIAAGPDGNLWFSEFKSHKIGRISTSGTISEFPIPSQRAPWGITAGPDGAMWFASQRSLRDHIDRITVGGVFTTAFSLFCVFSCLAPQEIAPGPDGKLWFSPSGISNPFGRSHSYGIGSVTTTGGPKLFQDPSNTLGGGIAAGPDGNIWFTEPSSNQIGRFDIATGSFTEFGGLSPGAGPMLITAGPPGDPHMWFTEFDGSQIANIHV